MTTLTPSGTASLTTSTPKAFEKPYRKPSPIQKHFIHGRETDSHSSEVSPLPNFSPSTGNEISRFQVGRETDLNAAVQSAQKGFQIWSSMSGAQRGRILMNAARLIRERNDELAELEVLDTGKPISEARTVDIPSAAEALEYFAGAAATLTGKHFDLGNSFAYTRREPLGVCAGIGAWNYPFQIACWKSAPALACGNAMIYKPSELTPITALELAKIYTEAGLPDGVFNVLQGDKTTGEILARHPSIRKVSLTGSVPTGMKVMSCAAETLKHVTLELGGKSPLIVFGDSPIDQSVSAAILANFFNQGEICCNGTRVFVEESFLPKFLERLVPRVQKIRIGNPMDPETQMGALISQAHREKVLQYIESGKKEGAKLICGGEIPKEISNSPESAGGYFITPAIFTGCQDSMKIVKEEIFGPVMSILTFRTEDEVLERANQTSYGLAAGIMTQDIRRAHRLASRIQAGMIWINNYNNSPIEIPFGGYKNSGIGRENSMAAMDHYTQIKTVYVEMGEIQAPY